MRLEQASVQYVPGDDHLTQIIKAAIAKVVPSI